MEIQPNYGSRWYPAEQYPYRIIKWVNHSSFRQHPDWQAKTVGHYKTKEQAEKALRQFQK